MKKLFPIILILLILIGCSNARTETKDPSKVQDNNKVEEPDISSSDDIIDETPPDSQNSNPPSNNEEDDFWTLLLVNKEYPLTQEVDATLAEIEKGYKADERIIDAYNKMKDAAYNEGINLHLHSAYRSISKQKTLFERKVDQYKAQGYNDTDAKDAALQWVAYPGQSEHHTGLCVDITSEEWLKTNGSDPLIHAFKDSKAGIWLYENSAEYGFILRYPEGKEEITGYTFEPWHFRYVGVDHAKKINEKKYCLEEYLEALKK